MIAAIKHMMDTTPQILPQLQISMKEVYEPHELMYKVYDNGFPDYAEHYATMMFKRKFQKLYVNIRPHVMNIDVLTRSIARDTKSMKFNRLLGDEYAAHYKSCIHKYIAYTFRFLLPFCNIQYKQSGMVFNVSHSNRSNLKTVVIECVHNEINLQRMYDAIGKIGLNKVVDQTTTITELKQMRVYLSRYTKLIKRIYEGKRVHYLDIAEAADHLKFMPFEGKRYLAYCEVANLFMENIFDIKHAVSYIYYIYLSPIEALDNIIDEIREEFYMFHVQKWVNQVYLTQAISNLTIV